MIFILNTSALYNKFRFVSITVLIILFFNFLIFKSAFFSSEYSFYLFNEIRTIDSKYYLFVKILNVVSIIISYSFISCSLYSKFFNIPLENNKNITNIAYGELSLNLGVNVESGMPVIIPEKGLYQNILVTGTIGTRQNIFCYVSFC